MARIPRPRLPRPRRPRLRRERPTAGGPRFARLRGWVGRAGEVVGAVGRAPGRLFVAVDRGLRAFWSSLSAAARRRLLWALGAVAAIALVWLLAVPALPCQAPGGDECPPPDDAIRLVPADALGYLHLNVDPDTEQFDDAAEIASRLPGITRQAVARLEARLPGPDGRPSFRRDIEPWFGGEGALAFVPAGGRAAEEVQLLEVGDVDRAQRFASSIASGEPRATTYRDVQVRVDRRGLTTAMVGGFLVIGRESGVRDVIDAESGAKGTASLADASAADAARDALPDKRLADAFLSEDGIDRLVANPRGPLSTFASVVSPEASTGVAAAVVASDDGLEVDVRSELDPARSKAHPGFFTAFPRFDPTLAGSLPSQSLGYIGIGDPGKTLSLLLDQATAEEPGLAAAADELAKRVKELGKVDLEEDLFPALVGEAAFALEPSPAGQGGGQKKKGGEKQGGLPRIAPPPAPPGAPAPPPASTQALPNSKTPFLEFLGAEIDADRVGEALAGLQRPLAKALDPSSGRQAPVFNQTKIGDLTAHSLRLSPTVDLTYAIVNSTLVVATNPVGVQRLVNGEGGLDGTDLFDQATDGFPAVVSVLGYLDLRGLIALGERAGLAEDPAYATFAPEIRTLHGLGLAVESSPDELATDLRLVVGEGPGEPGAAGQTGGGAPSD